jgi:pimeloyl-ACP methyl ester carboxylesterase
LADSGCSVVAPDLRGHGLSPATSSYRFVDMAADLLSVGSEWDLVLGHSLAGPITASFASQSDGVGKLLLLDPLLDIPSERFDEVVSDQLSELDPVATAESLLAINPRWHLEDCFHKAVGARATSPFVVGACLRDNAPYHHLGLLERLDVATVILGSDPEAGALFLPQSLTHLDNALVTYRMIEGAGHSLHREQPELVVEAALGLV